MHLHVYITNLNYIYELYEHQMFSIMKTFTL